uniref:protein indeterminate-domain 4, chloroplastic-like isoform X2 n=1 Tax=Erigeron canadensis TaxID=72917 RepID=UPI001CB8A24A|nr:protein indeterminate-domain 4, chloroplastic-like isoform X2 [Erigeron canadensis]
MFLLHQYQLLHLHQLLSKRRKEAFQELQANPDAEVIALSPKTLMATNRFICEVCNKGFQREQNLQLHRRGHNLPWKLKQKTNKEVKRKVYLCPEPSCVHHDPSRALGDLTGIKKHFSRKHGEKKYKCEKCSKKYAVQSDWKAHSKTCGTREYRCDCGTLFSRRDSFITHRAFCDALAQESARNPSSLGAIGSHLFGNHPSNSMNLGLGSQIPHLHQSSTSNMLSLGNTNFQQSMLPPSQTPLFSHPQDQQQMSSSSLPFFTSDPSQGLNQVLNFGQQSQQLGLMANKPNIQGLMQLPDLHSDTSNISPNIFNLGFYSGNSNGATNGLKNNDNDNQNNETNMSSSSGFMIPDDHQFNAGGGSNDHIYFNSPQESQMQSHMSATALLQKAAQMGSTTSNNNATTLLKSFASSSTSSIGGGEKSQTGSQPLSVNFDGRGDQTGNPIHGLMNSLRSGGASMFGGYAGDQNGNMNFGNINEAGKFNNNQNFSLGLGNSKRTTLDFLGVGYSPKQHHPQPHPGHINVNSLDPRVDSSSQASHELGGSSNLQGT